MSKSSMVFFGVALLVGSMCYPADGKKHFIGGVYSHQKGLELVDFLHTKYCVPGGLDDLNNTIVSTCLTHYRQQSNAAAIQSEQEMAAKREQQKASSKERIDVLRKQVVQAQQAAQQRAELLEAACSKEEKRAQQQLTRSEQPVALQAANSALVLHLPRVPAPVVLRDQQPVKGPQSSSRHRPLTPLVEDRPLSPFDFKTDFGLDGDGVEV